jgi:hypothetical protein
MPSTRPGTVVPEHVGMNREVRVRCVWILLTSVTPFSQAEECNLRVAAHARDDVNISLPG